MKIESACQERSTLVSGQITVVKAGVADRTQLGRPLPKDDLSHNPKKYASIQSQIMSEIPVIWHLPIQAVKLRALGPNKRLLDSEGASTE